MGGCGAAARPGPAAVADPAALHLAGVSRGESLDDLVYLDTRHMHWCQPRTSHPPRPRAQHAAAVVGSRLMLFGGSQGGTFFGDLASLDVESRTTRVSLVRFAED